MLSLRASEHKALMNAEIELNSIDLDVEHTESILRQGMTIGPASEEECKALYDQIHDFNASMLNTVNAKQINYAIRDKGRLIAGIKSTVYFGEILFIATLFVDKDHRHLALGSYLLKRVEDEAKMLGARLAHLDTFDFQASNFYPKFGYELFGVLDDCPTGHKRYYFKKSLVDSSTASPSL